MKIFKKMADCVALRSALCGLVFLFLVAAASSLAQQVTATLSGTITDTSGAAIPNATVTAQNADTGYVAHATTNGQGEYRIDLLPVGSYSVTVDATGFKKFIRNGIVLELGQSPSINAQLAIGNTSETVTVTSAAPLINTTNGTVGSTVENKEIENLPIVDRNVYSLLTLVPGVQTSENANVLGFPAQTTLINGGVDINNTNSVNYYLDGGTNMTGLRNNGNTLPTPDAVQEFRVETNNYSAEYGRFPSGVISVITKSGTNTLHGSLFEFNRQTAFDAKAYTAKSSSPLHRNQYGGTIGGPLIRNKTFFFFSYGGLRQITTSYYNSALVPDAAQAGGNFAENLPTDLGPITSCSQKVTAADKANDKFIVCNPNTKKPYVGNVISQGDLDPTAQALLNPKSGLPGVSRPNLPGNYFGGFQPNLNNSDEFLLKIDHQLTQRQRLTGAVYETGALQNKLAGGNMPGWSVEQFASRQWNGNLSDTFTINPNLINQVWATYLRDIGGRQHVPAVSLHSYGSDFTPQGDPSLPQISVSGYFTLGEAIDGPKAGTNYYELRDMVLYTRGRHTMSIGGEFGLDKDVLVTNLNNYGTFNFTGVFSNNQLSDFVLGLPVTMNQDTPDNANDNFWQSGYFFQDDFRFRPNLTVNLGLRYDIQTAPTDTQNRYAQFVLGQKSTVVPSAPAGMLFVGDKGVPRGAVPTRYNHISPRFGFAWDPFSRGRTSVRGGAGLFWGSVSGNEWNEMSNFQPFSVRQQFNTVHSLTHPYADLPGGVSPFPYYFTPSNPKFITPAQLNVIQPGFQWPYTYQMNLAVEQELGQNVSMSVGYVGSLSRNDPFLRDLNYPIYNSTATTKNVNNRRPIDTGVLSSIAALKGNQSSSYHALQMTASARMGRQFTLRGFYVFSKTLESVGMEASNSTAQNFNKLYEERGRADNDVRNTFMTSLVWLVDYYHHDNKLVGAAVNGWQISPIIHMSSGSPFTVTTGKDNNMDGNNTDRPNVVGNPLLNPHRSRPQAMAEWFNTSAFVANPIGTDGNAPRDYLDRPGYKSVDLALFRDFTFRERYTLQARAESTNAFNFVNLSGPNSTLSSSAVGKITGAGAMRQMQFGMRLTF